MDETFEGAWTARNVWNGNTIGGYHTYVFGKISSYEADAKKFTCEDLALSLLIDYASTNSLPVTIKNGTGTYNSRTYTGDVESFKNRVLETSGAHDLLEATKEIPSNQMKEGDLILMYDGNGNYDSVNDKSISHIQVGVTDIVDTNSKEIIIKQGNVDPSKDKRQYRDRADPSDEQYLGVEIQDRKYNLDTNIFYGNSEVDDAIDEFGMLFRRWQFKNF